MNKRNIENTRNALLQAAEKLMTEYDDPSKITARMLTKEAGVNLAMINYCFGSRESLLFEIFDKLQAEAMNNSPAFRKILEDDTSPKEKLIEIYFHSMKLMLDNYNLARSVTKYVIMNRELSAKRGSLKFVQAHFKERKTENECRLIAYELASLHELAVLRHEEIKNVCGIDLKNDEELRNYIRNHINMYLD